MTLELPFSFTLSAPVATTAGPIGEITITRLPQLREFLQSGLPVAPDGSFDMAALVRLLADCSSAPEFVFSRMDGSDLFNLALQFRAALAPQGPSPFPLRRPTGADLIAAGSPLTALGEWAPRSVLALACALSGQDAEAIGALPGPDFLAIVNEIAGFLGRRPATSSGFTST